jgi:hypothetical protein
MERRKHFSRNVPILSVGARCIITTLSTGHFKWPARSVVTLLLNKSVGDFVANPFYAGNVSGY